MALVMYGIRNCDTVKRARAWLAEREVEYAFHDYKAMGVEAALLQQWAREIGWEKLINRSGTTFRKLDPMETANLDAARALALMHANPSLIRRPIVTGAGRLLVGFDPTTYEAAIPASPR